MNGFKFCGEHSSDYGLVCKSINRTLKSPARYDPITIPNRHGQIDIKEKVIYDNRVIKMQITLMENNLSKLRLKAREVAFWLSQRGRLEFDDEPGVFYEAACYEQIDIDMLVNIGSSDVSFICSPFAFKEAVSFDIKNGENPIVYSGTAETPVKIILENISSVPITNIRITQIKKKR
jgi:predicted phage tail component-like protein